MSLNILALTSSQDGTQLSLQSIDDKALHEFAAILETARLFVVKPWARAEASRQDVASFQANKESNQCASSAFARRVNYQHRLSEWEKQKHRKVSGQ